MEHMKNLFLKMDITVHLSKTTDKLYSVSELCNDDTAVNIVYKYTQKPTKGAFYCE